jgi:endo-1,4-beta-mannosidase
MICTDLDTTSNSEENRYIEKFFKIDLTTFEQRVALQKNLREKNELLLNHLIKVKNYILTNCKLEELL